MREWKLRSTGAGILWIDGPDSKSSSSAAAADLLVQKSARCMGEALCVRVALLKGRPMAAIVTLRHGSTLVYKYGCSNAEYHHPGAMPWLLWRVIEEGKASGYWILGAAILSRKV